MAGVADTTTEQQKLISFKYEATSIQGKMVKGTIKATGEIEAERLLINQGYTPISVEAVPSMWSLEEALPTLFHVKPRDIIIFSRQLATLLRSGISLLPAMEILAGQKTNSRSFQKVLDTIVNDLRSGGSFSQAVTKQPKAFSEIYSRTITVGEQTGSMEIVLNQMADYMEKQGEAAKKVGKAMTYPMIVLVAGVVVVVIMMTVVMPNMLGMFTTMGVDLPFATRILIGATNFFGNNWLYIVIFLSAVAATIMWMLKQPKGKRILDKLRLTLPLVGPPTLLGELSRFARTMAMLVTAGLSLQEIMELIPQSSNNLFIREALNQVNEGLILGEGLSEPMSRIELFPPLLIQMVAVGEESNSLDFSMGVVADFYEVSAEEKMSTMISMLTPISTVVIALFVGFIAIAVLMPMYTLTSVF